ncbi:MAG: succinate dehydrogenase cytochrome b subunit [Elusimicrobiota bacterium]
MRLLKLFLGSSIGKKQLVALTGLMLIGFLMAHLSGNLLMLKAPELFDEYAEFLTHHPLLIPAEIALAAIFLGHIILGLTVTVENFLARPERYAVNASAGGRTLGSSTMAYTGLLTLVFLGIHVFTLKLQLPEGASLFAWVIEHFRIPVYMGFYVLAMVSLGVHLSHGVRSALQTFGVDHPTYTPVIEKVTLAFAVVLAAGFGALPLWGFFRGG